MATYDAGTALLQVVPSFRGVQSAIVAQAKKWGADGGQAYRREFDEQLRGLGREVPVGPGRERSRREGSEAGGAYADAFRRRIEAAAKSLPPLRVTAATSEAEQKLRDLRVDLEQLSRKTVGVDIDAASASAELARIDGELTALGANSPDVQVRVDSASARAQLAALQSDLRRVDGQDVEIDVRVNDFGGLNTFTGRLTAVAAAGALIGPAIIPVAGAAAAAVAAIGPAAIGAASGVGVLAVAFYGIGDAVKAMAGAQSSAAADAEKASERQAAAASAVASAQRQVESAEAGLVNARANAARAAEQGAARIAKAQAAVVDAEQAAARSAEESARRVADAQDVLEDARRAAAESAEDAARRVAEAQERVVDAEEAAARAAESASRRIADAGRRLADAQQASADVSERAARRVADAEESLADAQRRSLDVQQSLNDARREASERLEDLASRSANGALRERQAVLDLADAESELADARANPEATAEDLARTQLAYDMAVQRLSDLRRENQRLAVDYAEAARAGVEGSDEVRDAQDRIAEAQRRVEEAQESVAEATRRAEREQVDAQRRVADATQAVVDAQVNLQRVQVDGAERVADAQQGVTDALRAQQQAAVQSAERIADAQQGVTDATRAQAQARIDAAERVRDAEQGVAEAVAASADAQRQSAASVAGAQRSLLGAQAALTDASRETGDVGSAAMRKLEESLAVLSPAGVAFATFLYGLRDEWKQVQAAAQGGLLPGVQAGIEALLPFLPQVTGFVGGLAETMGDLFASAGRALTSPFWRDFFSWVASTAGPNIELFAGIIGDLAQGFAGLLKAFDPLARDFGEGLANMADGFARWASSLGENDTFQAFLGYLREVGPRVASALGDILTAVVQLLVAMAPFGPLVLEVVAAFARLISAIPPGVLQFLVTTLGAVVLAFKVLGPVVAFVSGIMAAMSAGVPVLGAVIAALGGPVTLAIVAIIALGAALVAAWHHSETFRTVVTTAWEAVRDAVVAAWTDYIWPALQAFAGFILGTVVPAVVTLWQGYILPAFQAIGAAVATAWDKVIFPALRAMVGFWQNVLAPAATWLWQNVFRPTFDGISAAVKFAWDYARAVFDLWVAVMRNVVGPAVMWLWERAFKPAFDGIGAAAKWLWDKAIKPAFEGIADVLDSVWNEGIRPTLAAFGDFMEDTVAPAFRRGLDIIKGAWNSLSSLAVKPVNFIIETVYTNGIKKLFDKVAGAVGSDTRLPVIGPIDVPKFATGGIYPGYTPGRDIGLIGVSGGEAIMRPEWTRAIGSAAVHEMNAVARTQGVEGVRRYLHGGGPSYLGGFSTGGVVSGIADRVKSGANWAKEGIADAASAVKDFVVGGLRKAVEIGLTPVRAALSSIGGGTWGEIMKVTASKMMGGLLDFAGGKDAEGGNVAAPLSGSAGGPWPPRQYGVPSPNVVAAASFIRRTYGLDDIGIIGSRPNASDHPWGKALDAMVYNNAAMGNAIASYLVTNPEAFGTKYVIWWQKVWSTARAREGWRPMEDRGSATANHFDHVHASFYDSGGYLPPGLSLVMNATGKPEPVFTHQQFQNIEALAQGGGAGGDVNVQVLMDSEDVTGRVLVRTGLDRIATKSRAR